MARVPLIYKKYLPSLPPRKKTGRFITRPDHPASIDFPFLFFILVILLVERGLIRSEWCLSRSVDDVGITVIDREG